MHMKNNSQKSSLICKNYLTKVVCMKFLSTQLMQSLNYYFARCTLLSHTTNQVKSKLLQQSESLTKATNMQNRTVT